MRISPDIPAVITYLPSGEKETPVIQVPSPPRVLTSVRSLAFQIFTIGLTHPRAKYWLSGEKAIELNVGLGKGLPRLILSSEPLISQSMASSFLSGVQQVPDTKTL
jgi:hypothetical protein